MAEEVQDKAQKLGLLHEAVIVARDYAKAAGETSVAKKLTTIADAVGAQANPEEPAAE